MAELAITKCDPVQVEKQYTGPAVEAIAEGDRCRFDVATGHIALGNATAAAEVVPGGIALHAAAIGEAVTIVNRGIVDIGPLAAFDNLAIDAPIYVGDTDGQFGTAAGDATVDVIVGRVIPHFDGLTPQNLLELNGL